MDNSVVSSFPVYAEPVRKLSPWRVLLGIGILAAVTAGGFFGYRGYLSYLSDTSHAPWFASYVDVTATPSYAFDQLGATSHPDTILSFIVSSPTSACTPTWGGAYTLTQADDQLDLARRIARLQQQGGSVAVSFGGKLNSELATDCTNEASLEAAYRSVITHYNLNTIDLDLENSGLSSAADARRATAIAALQSEFRAAHKNLAVWVTLPVAPTGLTTDGTSAVATLLAARVDLAGVNLLTMDYGSSRGNMSMVQASENAITATQRQLGILYDRASTRLSDASLWSKLGVTPMIGQNDTQDEVLTLADAASLNSFVRAKGVGRMSMWSANRDITCGGNYVDTKVVSDSCSGIDQGSQTFASVLGSGFTGHFSLSAGLVTRSTAAAQNNTPDNPATSPYQIWSPTGAYLEGTKVVWHHNVYQAKWWTEGDTPDNPVLQTWQTPWQLIGPVLPGESPVPQPTLPPGTYPDWDGTDAYNTGTRVLFNGVPYQAKWWNSGSSPAAATSNPDTSPWVPLTQAQVSQIDSATGTTTSN
jgi:chitinase